MEDNIPRASIHVGNEKKSFSVQVSNEAERRGWDEKRYQLKNAELEKNNHYNFSRKHLNFEITKEGKIVPLGSNPVSLHEKLQRRLDKLGFKPYMDADHPGQIAENSPNFVVNVIIGGDHAVMHKLAFGDQKFDPSDPNADQSNIVLMQGIFNWAHDTHDFACRKWGPENVIGFCVHCDETSVHAHIVTVPVSQVKKRGRIGNVYVSNDNPEVELSTREWKALPKEERGNYTKTQATKDKGDRVSFAKVWGETREQISAYISQLHTDYHEEVGYKYGLERGIPYDELTDEEKRARKHKDKVTLEAERKAKLAIAEAEKQKAEIEAETAIILEQKDEAQKDLKSAQSGFIARILKPGKLKQEEAEKMKGAYNAGLKETLDSVLKATGLKWGSSPSAETIGHQFRAIWNSNKNLTNELKAKDGVIAEKDTEIKGLNAKVTTLTEEINGLKYHISLIDEDYVERLRKSKIAETARADKAEKELISLRSDYRDLFAQWNAMYTEPEFIEARDKINARIEREARDAAERKAAEEREKKLKQERKTKILDKFISEGRQAQREFALSNRSPNFNQSELARVYYAIIALATKDNLSLKDSSGIETATERFLDKCDWSYLSESRRSCCKSWTNILTTREITFDDAVIDNFISFIDAMSCSADTYASVGGSNGCADQLTNWDGTQKQGLGAPKKKEKGGMSL